MIAERERNATPGVFEASVPEIQAMVKSFKSMVLVALVAAPAWAHSAAAARRSAHPKTAAVRPSLALRPVVSRAAPPVLKTRYESSSDLPATKVDIPMGASGVVGSVGVNHLAGAEDSHDFSGLAAARFAQPASLVGATFSYRF
jgi:hypothetical protein